MEYIEVKNLKYRYPHRKELALKGLNFSVERGEFIGILGQSKAGKSTLCQALVGLVPTVFGGAYGGSVTVDGWEAGKIPVAQMCRKVDLVFQNPFNQLSGARDTVFGEVAFGLQNLGIPREEIGERTQKCLRMMEVEAHRERNPFDLSGGQIQRVALASILAMQPEVLVLDEPTSQLDPQGSEEVFRVVERLSKTGITIIMVEHKMEKLARYCDRLLLLNEGEQIAYDTPQNIFSREDLGNFGVEAPVYTKIAKLFDARSGEGFPVTLEQMQRERQHFPETLTWKDEEVAIASVLAMKPQVLILDEPTIAQDMAGKRKLGALVRRLADEGCAVLAILHDMDFAAEYFERVIVMAHGKVLADGAKAEVFYEREALEAARLEQPHAAKLARVFGYRGHFLTVNDFERAKESCE